MMGYYANAEATAQVLQNGWFHTGDLAKIDEDGFIFICGRQKNVIVLKNGKNIFPEEMEAIVNKIEGVQESLIYGKQHELLTRMTFVFMLRLFMILKLWKEFTT